MTIESLQSKFESYRRSKDEYEAKANACIGAMSLLQEQIAELQAAKVPEKTAAPQEKKTKRHQP